MKDRRRANRRKGDRRAADRRQPSLVETIRGERNVWKREPGDKLLEQLEELKLALDGEEEEAGSEFNPYNRTPLTRRR